MNSRGRFDSVTGITGLVLLVFGSYAVADDAPATQPPPTQPSPIEPIEYIDTARPRQADPSGRRPAPAAPTGGGGTNQL